VIAQFCTLHCLGVTYNPHLILLSNTSPIQLTPSSSYEDSPIETK
jgi:hypothetical protein